MYKYAQVPTCTYMYLDNSICRYLGLFGHHIVSVVLHWNFEKAHSILHKILEIVLWVLFSTFEELILPIHGLMEDAGVIKLYNPSPIPCLYVAPVANMVGSCSPDALASRASLK
jgi:hypothetical protein